MNLTTSQTIYSEIRSESEDTRQPAFASGPVFVIGAPRSGTSILTWCLGQHSNIQMIEESHWISRLSIRTHELWTLGTCNGKYSHLSSLGLTRPQFLEKVGSAVDLIIKQTFINHIRTSIKNSCETDADFNLIDNAPLEQLINTYYNPHSPLQLIRSANHKKTRWVDGTPENTFYATGLLELFPTARFVHILRDPKDVALSLINFSTAGASGRSHSHSEAFDTWIRYVKHALLAEEAYGRRVVHRVNYEELKTKPEKSLRGICEFLGEDYEEACAEPLSVIINSSQKEIPLTNGDSLQKQAQDLYRKALTNPPKDKRDPASLSTLNKHFLATVSRFNANSDPQITVLKWGPQTTAEGSRFNVQASGVSSIWVSVTGISKHPNTHVVFGDRVICGNELSIQDDLLTFEVRDELIAKAGSHEISVFEGDTGRRVNVGSFQVTNSTAVK
jgi:hypothetical protein